MKKYLTATFLLLGMLSIIIGYQFDVRWNGIASWGFALIFLLCAAYCTKYIPEKKKQNHCEEDYL